VEQTGHGQYASVHFKILQFGLLFFIKRLQASKEALISGEVLLMHNLEWLQFFEIMWVDLCPPRTYVYLVASLMIVLP